MLEPSICLDARGSILSLTRLEADESLKIEFQQISPDEEDYVLVSRDTYISNVVVEATSKIMIV